VPSKPKIPAHLIAANLVGFNPRHRYPPVGKCIYCGRTGKLGETLGEEHIIPISFEGNLILPSASCLCCGKKTSAFESHCVNGMAYTARPHLGIRGRQKRSFSSRGRVLIDRGSYTESRSVPLHEHPGALIVPILPYPTALTGALPVDRDIPLPTQAAIRPMTPDLATRAQKIMDGRGIDLAKALKAIEFYRLLAKIAHAFTTAELGVGGFIPCLLSLILRAQRPMFADHFVGSAFGDDPRSPRLHDVGFISPIKDGPLEMIVVRIRLFASLSMPTHYVVSGARSLS
jgi:hypothetical protein